MVEWNRNNNAVVAARPGTLGETVVVSPAGFILGLALWGLAGYGAYKLITR